MQRNTGALATSADDIQPDPIDGHSSTVLIPNQQAEKDAIDIKSVINAQKYIRGYLARKHFAINHLSKTEMVSYSTFIVGNDPVMPKELDSFNVQNEKIAIVGTSGMRVVSLACKLGNVQHTPKIFLVDNSREVHEFWQAMRNFMQDDSLTKTEQDFIMNFPQFLEDYRHLYRPLTDLAYKDYNNGATYLNQNPAVFFSALFKKYGYEFVRAIIKHVSLIQQTWEDPLAFDKIKNILSYLGIRKVFVNPTNIWTGYTSSQTGKIAAFFKNISKLEPTLSIHTDLCNDHGIPENTYLFTTHDPMKIIKTLFADYSCGIKKDTIQINDSNDQEKSIMRNTKDSL
jgi:hypothetical protein